VEKIEINKRGFSLENFKQHGQNQNKSYHRALYFKTNFYLNFNVSGEIGWLLPRRLDISHFRENWSVNSKTKIIFQYIWTNKEKQ
jgi:hypothetical protein